MPRRHSHSPGGVGGGMGSSSLLLSPRSISCGILSPVSDGNDDAQSQDAGVTVVAETRALLPDAGPRWNGSALQFRDCPQESSCVYGVLSAESSPGLSGMRSGR